MFNTNLCVSGPTKGLANSCTNALEANIIPTATVSSTRSLCRFSPSFGTAVAFSGSNTRNNNST